jgi:hypothetical protein
MHQLWPTLHLMVCTSNKIESLSWSNLSEWSIARNFQTWPACLCWEGYSTLRNCDVLCFSTIVHILISGPKLYFLGVWHKYQRKDSHRRKIWALWQADICNREQRWTWSLPGMHICPGFMWCKPHVCFKETLLLDAFHAISFSMPA